MPRCADISSILLLATAAVPASPAAAASASEWTVNCHAGEDGFAANCEAVREEGDYVLRVASADAQVFVAILHPRCETNYRNFDRTDLIGLSPAERRALMMRAFHEIAADLVAACPGLSRPTLRLGAMPDVAILSPALDR